MDHGDPDGTRRRFIKLYDENYRRVLAYALTHTEPHAAEDVASETFLIAWRRRAEVTDPTLPWLLGVARNLLHKQRDSGNRRHALAERIGAMTSAGDLTTWDVAEHVVDRDSALAALTRLAEGDLEVLALVMWHGLTPRAAAEVVGCSVPAFSVRLHRARRRLAKCLDRASVSPAPTAHPSPRRGIADRTAP